jgi:hypothetical protein
MIYYNTSHNKNKRKIDEMTPRFFCGNVQIIINFCLKIKIFFKQKKIDEKLSPKHLNRIRANRYIET